MNWHLNAKIGPYLGLIRSSQVQEGQTITSFNSDFRRLDYGLNIQIAPVYEVGKFEIPAAYKQLNRKLPDLSPVNALPVLVPP